MVTVKIYLLGRFEILVNDVRIDEQLAKSRKGCLLIQYLLLHRGQSIRYQDLYNVIWPNETSTNPESALKTLVSRLREMLGHYSISLKNSIGTIRGAYRWVEQPDVFVDIYRFEELCMQLKECKAADDSMLSAFSQLYDLYLGDLLPLSSGESWVVTRSVYYQNLYLSVVYHHLALLESASHYNEIITVCRVALDINAFDERLHMMLMNALVKTNRTHEALMQYRHAAGLHIQYLGIQPSENLRQFYERLTNTGNMMEADILRIRDELNAYGNSRGAYICDYDVFKEIYDLQARFLKRSNTYILFLALIVITRPDDHKADVFQRDEIMRSLLSILQSGLRQSDTVTHYGANQFLVLLPLKSYDDGKTVMERVKRNFYTKQVTSDYVFNYRLIPVSEHPDPAGATYARA